MNALVNYTVLVLKAIITFRECSLVGEVPLDFCDNPIGELSPELAKILVQKEMQKTPACDILGA